MKIGVAKNGNIATSLVVELMLDERADREDIEVRVFTSGAKMQLKDCEDVVKRILEYNPDLIIYISPNPSLKQVIKALEMLKGRRVIVIGDSPGIKAKEKFEELGFGYILIKGDAMIGARREFLDPIEMVLFNADMLKILAVTGALRIVYEEIDKAIKNGEYLPRVVVDSETAVKYSGLNNPYARVKAMACYEIAEKVAELNVKGCFIIKEREKYIATVAGAHEMLRLASLLADEIREIEKINDSVLRKPHSRSGDILSKLKLFEKPS